MTSEEDNWEYILNHNHYGLFCHRIKTASTDTLVDLIYNISLRGLHSWLEKLKEEIKRRTNLSKELTVLPPPSPEQLKTDYENTRFMQCDCPKCKATIALFHEMGGVVGADQISAPTPKEIVRDSIKKLNSIAEAAKWLHNQGYEWYQKDCCYRDHHDGMNAYIQPPYYNVEDPTSVHHSRTLQSMRLDGMHTVIHFRKVD